MKIDLLAVELYVHRLALILVIVDLCVGLDFDGEGTVLKRLS